MLNIEPIKLLSGSHADIGTTGQGCFMNVVAYLNGEAQITDQSSCVCVTVRPIAIWVNDFMNDSERHLLIPFVHRAMGSATDDLTEMVRRAWLANDFAKYAAKSAAKYAESAAEYAAKYAEYAAKYAAESAKSAAESAKYAESAAKYAAESAKSAAIRRGLIDAALRFLDAALPPADIPMQRTIDCAQKLVELCKKSGACV